MSGSIVPALTRRNAGPPRDDGTEARYAQAHAFADNCRAPCPFQYRRLLLLAPSARVWADMHAGQPLSAGPRSAAACRGDSRAAARGVNVPAGEPRRARRPATGPAAFARGERLRPGTGAEQCL